MLVVLSILAAVAVPRYFDYRERAAASSLAASFKVMRSAFIAYARDNGAFPPDNDGSPGYGSNLIAPYLQDGPFERDTPIGGRWNWNNLGGQLDMCIYNVGSSPSAATLAIMTRADGLLDDGVLTTGQVRWEPGSWGGTFRYFISP